MQGVGETLRGTLNYEIDSRFPRSNAEKAAAANARNQDTLDKGQKELARLSERSEFSKYGGPPGHPAYKNNPSRSPFLGPQNHHEPAGSGLPPNANNNSYLPPIPPSQPLDSQYAPPPTTASTTYDQDEMTQVPTSFSPESNGSAPAKKQSGFRKLIKRKPVGGS